MDMREKIAEIIGDCVETSDNRGICLAADLIVAALPDIANQSDTDLLDAIAENYWDLKCEDVPTCGDDADVVWTIVEHHMGPKGDVEVAYSYHDDPREAIRLAIAKSGE